MSGPIVLRDGTEIPAFPMGIAARLAIFDTAIDCRNKPAVKSIFAFACVGLVWERAVEAESSVRAADRSVPDAPFKPYAECAGDIYAYGAGVLEALVREDVMTLRRLGDAVIIDTWNGLQPPADKIEEAAKNSAPEAGTSATSSGSVSAASETPSPS